MHTREVIMFWFYDFQETLERLKTFNFRNNFLSIGFVIDGRIKN